MFQQHIVEKQGMRVEHEAWYGILCSSGGVRRRRWNGLRSSMLQCIDRHRKQSSRIGALYLLFWRLINLRFPALPGTLSSPSNQPGQSRRKVARPRFIEFFSLSSFSPLRGLHAARPRQETSARLELFLLLFMAERAVLKDRETGEGSC